MDSHQQERRGCGPGTGITLAASEVTPIIPLVKGVFTMAEFIVAIDHITYYAVQAKDEVTAIDLVLEGEGEEISSETRDAYITEYQSSDSIAD
jgi:hypothetical protein